MSLHILMLELRTPYRVLFLASSVIYLRAYSGNNMTVMRFHLRQRNDIPLHLSTTKYIIFIDTFSALSGPSALGPSLVRVVSSHLKSNQDSQTFFWYNLGFGFPEIMPTSDKLQKVIQLLGFLLITFFLVFRYPSFSSSFVLFVLLAIEPFVLSNNVPISLFPEKSDNISL